MKKKASSRRAGFGLIELLVIIALLAMLAAFLLPAVSRVHTSSAKTLTMNNLKQIGIALHDYHDTYKKLPPAYGGFRDQKPMSFHVHLLPFVEQGGLFTEYQKQEGGGDTKDAVVPPYHSEMDYTQKKPLPGVQNYPANLRVFSDKGIASQHDKSVELAAEMPCTGKLIQTIRDGTSNTVMTATKLAVCGEDGGSKYAAQPNTKYAAFFGQHPAKKAASPDDATSTFQLAPDARQCLTSPLMAQSFDKRGILVGICDGSVRSVDAALSAETWNRALQPNDGLALGNDW